MEKIHLPGTCRTRYPEDTWEILVPRLLSYGVTRLADVTGLDHIGIPVYLGIRPLGRTLSLSQGKGTSKILAKVSAAMEAIEMWHAENACPASVTRNMPPEELALPYDFEKLRMQPGCLATKWTAMSWIRARVLADSSETLIPRDCVLLDRITRSAWWSIRIRHSGNGLASGNTREEAIIHALYELIERDAVAELLRRDEKARIYLDTASVDDPTCQYLLELLTKANIWLEAVAVENRWGVPCFIAYLWSEDHPLLAIGSGANSDPGIALSRAITEAAQTRLNTITGARDDLNANDLAKARSVFVETPFTAGKYVTWQCISPGPAVGVGLEEEINLIVARVQNETGNSPVVVDLSTTDAFAVVKVLATGMRFIAGERAVHRPRGAGKT